MVFFSCNACGESLKKNQVEKHYQTKCRSCEVLSCVDCSKEFWGDDYKQHIKCMTEEEKYSGKNYQPKANANKGEKKQTAWFEQVQRSVDRVAAADYKLKSVLEKVRDCPNVPRKKNKFENFLKSSLRVFDQRLLNKAWEAISSQLTANTQPADNTSRTAASDGPEVSKDDSNNSLQEDAQKLSKRQRKEERQKDRRKAEKKDRKCSENGESLSTKHKKGKKRKQQDVEDNAESPAEPGSEVVDRKKKKKKEKEKDKSQSQIEACSEDTGDVDESEVMVGEPQQQQQQEVPVRKFHWDTVIIDVLSAADDNTLSVKRLQKKVLAEYHARGGEKKQLSEEKLSAKFKHKLTKNSTVRVLKDRAKLIP